MFSAPWITGADLPDGTLVLTYDDGPGPNTLPIAEYLHAQGIAATFFVIGIQAYQQPAVLIRVRGLGHRLGNHTWTHPILPTRLTEGADIIDEVRRTAGLLGRGPIAFRPPYAEWTPAVAEALNADAALRDAHVGPVGWTVEGRDCLSEVVELPDGSPALLGQVPLEVMDFWIDMSNRRLAGNPDYIAWLVQ